MGENSKEIIINQNDLIVSATDKKGNILYTNEIFAKIAEYTKEELIGQPHSLIRHKDMPKVIFHLLWQRVLSGKTIYAFVKNRTKNGNYYWVKAYVKPVYKNGEISQIISYRKPMNDFAKEYITRLYKTLIDFEKNHSIDESYQFLMNYLEKRNLTYDQFIDRLSLEKSVENVAALNINTGKLKNAHLLFKQHITTEVNEGNHYVEVVGSCCCDFGKWIKTVEKESFTSMNSWKEVITIHDRIHEEMTDYVEQARNGALKEELEQILTIVEKDVDFLFEKINQTIDNSKE